MGNSLKQINQMCWHSTHKLQFAPFPEPPVCTALRTVVLIITDLRTPVSSEAAYPLELCSMTALLLLHLREARALICSPWKGAREERRSPGWKIPRPGQHPCFVSWPGFLLPFHRCKPWGKPPRMSGDEKGEASPGSWSSQKAAFGAPSTHSLLLPHPYLRIGRESRKGKTSGRNRCT